MATAKVAAMRCSLATQITMRRGDHRYITTAAVRQLGAHNSQSPHLLSKTTIGRVQAAKQSAIRASASVSQELTQARKHPDQVSTAPAAGDLSYYRSFYDSFADNLERSSDSVWGNGQGAFSGAKDDFDLLSPAQWSPDAQALLKEHNGNAVKILMLGSCFPLSKETLQALTDEMAGILIDDWLEKQPPSVVAEHVRWWAAIVRRWEETGEYDYTWARNIWPASYDADPTLSKKCAELLCSSMSVLHKVSEEAEPAWFGHFLRESEMWAKSVHSEMKHKSLMKTTKETPEVHEFISYRGLCTGTTFTFMLAALSHGIRLSEKRVEEALPFLDVGSMIVGAFNDCLGARKDARTGQLNFANMVGRARAVNIHNMLVDLFEQEAAAWLTGAEEGDQSKEFFDFVRASLFGIQFYQLVAPRYTKVMDRHERVDILDGPPGQFASKESALKEQIRSFVHNLPGSTIQSLRAERVP